MKRKYIKLNDNYSHLSLGNIISTIKDESKNRTSAIQSEVFCAIFNTYDTNDSTINNYCIGSRSIGSSYKQIYINLKKEYLKNNKVFIDIICNILSILNGTIYDIKDINTINKDDSLKRICNKLYNISKNDLYVSKEYISKFRELLNNDEYYNLFIEMLIFAILEKKQPLYEDEKLHNTVEVILQNTDISVNDLQNFLLLELNEGINFSYSLKKLANDGNAYANYHLAVLEYRGEYTGTPNYYKAFEYFKKASLNNHPSAYWMMGNMILNNKVYTDNKSLAIEYFKKSASLGNIAALNSIGLCYKKGVGVKKDINKALDYFKRSASKGYAYALNNLGIYYESIKDYNNSYDCFFKSANLGESYACNKIGEINRINKNYLEAYKYYNKALESSYREITPWAYYNLAKYFYLTGNIDASIEKDTDKAIEYFIKADGLIESLQELFLIYYNRKERDKVYYYKNLIENHSQYNESIRKDIKSKIKEIDKISINLSLK